jgi:DNA repair photolyase
MKIIYEPKGKALEYAPLAANLYKGCGHGCTYCYAPSATYKKREDFYQNPVPRVDVIKNLEKDAKSIAGDERPVLLCFTSDPYQPIDDEFRLARQAIEVLNGNGIAVHVLTKGTIRAARDFDLLSKNKNNAFSVTLTMADDEVSKEWEPDADLPSERIEGLKRAKEQGIQTWVSFEPVIIPDDVFKLIDRTREYVDLYKVGRWNYDKRAKEIDWAAFRDAVVERLINIGKSYLIKKDLLAA